MKKTSHKYKHGGRINRYSIIISLAIVGIYTLTPSDMGKEVYVAEQPATKVETVLDVIELKKDVKTAPKNETIEKITKHFPRSHKTMIAIAYAESGLHQNAQNWNCYYNYEFTDKNKVHHPKGSIVYTEPNKNTYSTFCKVPHRKYAWSIDCFVLQRNYKGLKECPADVTLDKHLEEVAELSKIQGFGAWSSYNSKRYLAYLTN